MTQDDIFDRVKKQLVEALGVEEDDVTMASRLQGDLNAESIDFLEFGLKIDRNELFPESIFQGDPLFLQNGMLTPAGLDELRAKMPYADIGKFEKNPKFENIGDLFTVELITKYIQSKLK